MVLDLLEDLLRVGVRRPGGLDITRPVFDVAELSQSRRHEQAVICLAGNSKSFSRRISCFCQATVI